MVSPRMGIQAIPSCASITGYLSDRTTGLADKPDLSYDEQMFNMSTEPNRRIFFARGVGDCSRAPAEVRQKLVRQPRAPVSRCPVSVRGTPFWNRYA